MRVAFDCATFVSPVILLVTIYGLRVAEFYFLTTIACGVVIVFILMFNKNFKLINYNDLATIDVQKNQDNHVGIKLIKLSISVFRTVLFIVTGISILATDFKIFENCHRKTRNFGFSLMDLGVGLFIICHSMRVIRNSKMLTRSKNSFLK